MNPATAYSWDPRDKWRSAQAVEEDAEDDFRCPALSLTERGKPTPLSLGSSKRRWIVECKAFRDGFDPTTWRLNHVSPGPGDLVVIRPKGIEDPRSFEIGSGPIWVALGPSLILDYSEANELINEAGIEAVPGWLSALYSDGLQRATRTQLRALLDETEELLMGRRFADIDLILELADFGKLSSEIVLGLIRSFSIARAALTRWDESVCRAKEEFQRRGLPVKELMVGLLDKVDGCAD